MKVTIEPPVQRTVTIELTQREAELLAALLGHQSILSWKQATRQPYCTKIQPGDDFEISNMYTLYGKLTSTLF